MNTAESNEVGKCSLCMYELTQGIKFPKESRPSLERLRQTRYLGGLSGPSLCSTTMKGEQKKKPPIIVSISDCENGPDMRSAVASSRI